ncbi:MAG: tRNA pseudouridine(13) synthase TruD, partial [Candidatus Firestonebacteria bacterium]|nr:tRNA pseudouridine(13) synthase TruD [Candidatus Firestonebacteria bacterium]
MKFKIKCNPDDFIVKEIAPLPLSDKGEYGVYLLHKKVWNTVELLYQLSKELNIPFKHFSFGGKKDKYATTTQYITIRSPKIFTCKKNKYSLEFCGFTDIPMSPDVIQGNKFEITVRDIIETDIEKALKEIENIKSKGYPNYFDDQRFGSFNKEYGFIALDILKRHYSNALKNYLISLSEFKKKDFYNNHWNDWNLCLKRSSTNIEKKIFGYLIKNPKYFLSILKQIPKEGLSNHFSSYNAFIWNEVLRQIIIIKSSKELANYKGAIGNYVFYKELDERDFKYLELLDIPTLPYKSMGGDIFIDEIYNKIMENHEIKYSMFNKMKLRQVKLIGKRSGQKNKNLPPGITAAGLRFTGGAFLFQTRVWVQ